jgi:hypothetical protein
MTSVVVLVTSPASRRTTEGVHQSDIIEELIREESRKG